MSNKPPGVDPHVSQSHLLVADCASCHAADAVYCGMSHDGDHVDYCELCYADFGLALLIAELVAGDQP